VWPGTACRIYTNLLADVRQLVDATGQASLQVKLPDTPTVIGLAAFAQWGVIEAPSASKPLTLTGAARLVVGRPATSTYDSVATGSGAPTGVKALNAFAVLASRLGL
jgi:hypothetical protein